MAKDFQEICMDILLGFPYGENLQESFYVPAVEPRYVALPSFLADGYAGRWMKRDRRFLKGLWRHQGLALHSLEAGQNVCLTTKTSSGKSAVMIGRALRILDDKPNATVLTVYPAKALQTDQLHGWVNAFQAAGFKDTDIGVINGDTKEHDTRLAVVASAKNILITPDTLQSWLLPNLDNPTIKRFLTSLELLELDEAHVYDEILGSHAPHLFRRLQFVVDQLKRANAVKAHPRLNSQSPFQILAASASLQNSPQFMEQLTGQNFLEIGNDEDGSSKSEQDVVHLAADKDDELKIARHLIVKFLTDAEDVGPGTGICFVDSRMAVENLASEINRRLGKDLVVPYRGGYGQTDRDEIHLEISKGRRRFIIATSVLELGVNFSEIVVGLCVGKPPSPASLQQRLGRVGRSGKGLFVVIAPSNAFARGKRPVTLRSYCEGRNAEPTLYVDNERILAGHAFCLLREMQLLGLPANTPLDPARYHWTEALQKTMHKLRAGYPIMDEEQADRYRAVRKQPHRATRIRDVDMGRSLSLFVSVEKGPSFSLGTLTRLQALRECYPGAIYPHRLRRFEVGDWYRDDDNKYEQRIRMRPVVTRDSTRPIIQTWVFLPQDSKLPYAKTVGAGRARLTELQMTVTEKLEGYRRYAPSSEGQKSSVRTVYYNSSQGAGIGDQPATKKLYQHALDTTGVLIEFGRELFTSEELSKIASLVKNAYCARFNISPNNIDVCASRIYRQGVRKAHEVSHAIVIFDRNSSKLRLTRRLISKMDETIETMAQESGDKAIVERFASYYGRLIGERIALPSLEKPREMPSTEFAEPDIIPPGRHMWHEAFGSRKAAAKTTASVPSTGGWVVVEGFVRVEGEIFYRIKRWDNPAEAKKPDPPRGSQRQEGAAHLVPRRSLYLEPPAHT